MRKVNIQKTLTKAIIIVALIFGKEINAQTNNSTDLESWNLIQLAYKPAKKLKFDVEGQLRFKDNISVIDRYIVQLGTEYSIYKQIKIGGALRYIEKNDNSGQIQGYENYLRYNFDASNKHKIERLWIKYRLRFQNKKEIEEGVFSNGFDTPYLRYKLSFGYNIKKSKFEPEISGELFHPIGGEERTGVNAFRFTFGTSYSFKDFGKIDLFYRIQKELDIIYLQSTNIIGLKYSYLIKGY